MSENLGHHVKSKHQQKSKKHVQQKKSCMGSFSNAIISVLETVFFWIGYGVAKYPVPFLVGCIAVTGAAASGFIHFYEETDPAKLWVPTSSRVLDEMAWVNERFPGLTRAQHYIISADDVLTPGILQEVIQQELYRNLGLALLCVFVITSILLANLQASILVLMCVIFTLVEVGGLMYFWGIYINTVSAIQLILAIGLTIDYSAHVTKTFLTIKGNNQARSSATLSIIGPAVFNGAFSTFLAFVLMAGSTSFIFVTFFKVFLGVTLFGTFNGLVFLPVLLAAIGPDPYYSARELNSDGSLEGKRGEEVIHATREDLYYEHQHEVFSHGAPHRKSQIPRPQVPTVPEPLYSTYNKGYQEDKPGLYNVIMYPKKFTQKNFAIEVLLIRNQCKTPNCPEEHSVLVKLCRNELE